MLWGNSTESAGALSLNSCGCSIRCFKPRPRISSTVLVNVRTASRIKAQSIGCIVIAQSRSYSRRFLARTERQKFFPGPKELNPINAGKSQVSVATPCIHPNFIFLPSIFLPLISSSSLYSFCYHRKICGLQPADGLMHPGADPLLARLFPPTRWRNRRHLSPPHFSVLHFSAFDLFVLLRFFLLSPKNHLSVLLVSRKKEKRTKKGLDPCR